MTFASIIRRELRRSKLTTAQLAAAAGLTRAMVHYLLVGQRQPSLETAGKLAAALGISLDVFAPSPKKSVH